jgi:AcrR family transcriptional regulator
LRLAAIGLVDERGFDRVTVEDITEAVDVSPRTFFNHFASKEEALTSPDSRRLARLAEALAQRPVQELPLQALRAVLLADAAEMSTHRDEWLHQLAVLRRDRRLVAALANSWWVLERALSDALCERVGASPEDLSPAVLAATAVAALRVAVARWDAETHASLVMVLERAFDTLIDATQVPAPQPESR